MLGLALGVSLLACGPAEPRVEGMEVVEVVRDLLAAPPDWEVVAAHPELAPVVKVITPSFHYGRDGADMPALVVAPPGEVRFRIDAADAPARLVARAGVDVSVVRLLNRDFPSATFEFEVRIDGRLAFEDEITLVKNARQPGSTWVDVGGAGGLAVEAGEDVALFTRVRGEDGVPVEPPVGLLAGYGGLRLERSSLVPRARSSPEKPSFVLVVMDTLRADRLSVYGYERPTSPQLERLAARGVVFDNAYATSSWTWPSTASLLTGLEPLEHGVVRAGSCFLAQSIPTLAEELQRRGFATAAWSGNPLVTASRNFDQGFASFADDEEGFRKTDTFFEEVSDWLGEQAGRRFFLYLQLTEPHRPYRPLSAAKERFAPDVPENFFEERVIDIGAALHKGAGVGPDGEVDVSAVASAQERAFVEELYDASVWSGDHWLGRLLDRLVELGLDDETLVVFTSDHGEELFERGFLEHGHLVYGELVRAPLVLAGPGVPEGRRLAAPVSNRHVPRLLAELAGGSLDGAAPATWLFDDARDAEPVFYSTEKGWWRGRADVPIHGLRQGSYSLHYAPTGGDRDASEEVKRGDVRLFDLASDPQERNELSRSVPEVVEEMRAEIRRRMEEHARRRATPEFDVGEATRRLLERIGYAGGDD